MKFRITTISFLKGFSLVEMAIVLLILGVVLSGFLGALGANTETTRRLEAKNKLREIEEALYGFAQIHKRLPCPANDDNSGFESISGDEDDGNCTRQHGMLPNATLGLSGGVDENGFLLDPWGNPYRYSVADTTPGAGSSTRYTGRTGIQDIYDDAANAIVYDATDPHLRICDTTDCSGVIMSDVAPAVVLSMGNNWGSIEEGTASAEEEENAGDFTTKSYPNGTYPVTGSNDFVVTDYSEDNFDDMLIWISPHLLLSKIIAAGQLP